MAWIMWIPLVLVCLAGADEDCGNDDHCDVGVSALQKNTRQAKLHAATHDEAGAKKAMHLKAKMRYQKTAAKLMKKHQHFKNFVSKKQEPAGFSLASVCVRPEDFLPDNPILEMCVFETQPSMEECGRSGCFPDDHYDPFQPMCFCQSPSTCSALGGEWVTHTCGTLVHPQMDLVSQAFGEAAANGGSCEGIMLEEHISLADDIKFPAESCCSSYPKTFCEPLAEPTELVTPCATDDLFDAAAVVGGYCDLVFPGGQQCANAGCMVWPDDDGIERCHCQERESCVELGGTFTTFSCGEHVTQMYYISSEMQSIRASGGTCSEEAYEEIDDVARNCCGDSYPKTLCEPDREMPTPCVGPDNLFVPSNNLMQHCFINEFSAPECQHLGWHQVDGALQYEEPPQDAEACRQCGGMWYSELCEESMKKMLGGDLADALNGAMNGFGCGDHQYSIEQLNGKCCTTPSPLICQESEELQLLSQPKKKSPKKAVKKSGKKSLVSETVDELQEGPKKHVKKWGKKS